MFSEDATFCPVETVGFERGSKLREISALAFRGCDSLKSICLPASVEKLCGLSFVECGLHRIEIENGNKFYRVFGNSVMNLDGSRLIRYFGSDSEMSVPDCVEILEWSSFSYCDSIREILFGSASNLRVIEQGAFGFCKKLKSICIPSLVTVLKPICFSSCYSLQRVSFCSNSQLKRISERAFEYCQFESIIIPSSVEILEFTCFKHCEKLVTVTFPGDSKLVRIENRAFEKCSSLRSICLPSSVEYVGSYCFCECRSLVDFSFSTPCRIRELLDLPPEWRGLKDIPDSVEILRFSNACRSTSQYALNFGNESRLTTVRTWLVRSFLRFSSRRLKFFRSELEFGTVKSPV
jgi:uncharacterized protein YuzB (UPF0349 family)